MILFLNNVKFCMWIVIKGVGFFPSGFRVLLLTVKFKFERPSILIGLGFVCQGSFS